MTTVSLAFPLELMTTLPDFDRRNNTLIRFLNTINNFKIMYCGENNTLKEHNEFIIFQTAMKKIEDYANFIPDYAYINTLVDLETKLRNCFSDPSSIVQLKFQTIQMKSKFREHPDAFLERLIEKQACIMAQYRSDEKYKNSLEILQEELNITLIQTFIKGVHPDLGSHIKIFEITQLSEIKTILKEKCDILINKLRYGTNNRYPQNNRYENKRQQYPQHSPYRKQFPNTYSKPVSTNTYSHQISSKPQKYNKSHSLNHIASPNILHNIEEQLKTVTNSLKELLPFLENGHEKEEDHPPLN